MDELEVKGNKIVNLNGKEVLIKGISTNSPGIIMDEKHDILQDIREIKNFGANAIKIPVCPAYWRSNENYCSEILDPIVDLTEELGLYCCLDWHAQGNPSKNKTRKHGNDIINGFEKYDANQEVALSALDTLSKKYGKKKHVIFDIFSMPIDIENKDWREIAQKFVDKVRENSENIVIVNGTNWASDLSWVLENQISSENIVYGFCYYPLEMFQDLTIVFKIKEKYPIIFPECGWTPEGYFKGSEDNYGRKLKKYIHGNKFSFFAWVYHPKRVPVLLNSWNPDDLSEWGKFLKKEIMEK